MKLKGERVIGTKEVKTIVTQIENKEVSKGAGIRSLFAGGLSVKEISKETGILYNHVYNVVKNEVLVKGLSDEVELTGRAAGNTKKVKVLELLEEGKTIMEISKEMMMVYNAVWSIAKAAGYTNKQKAGGTK